LFAPPETFLGNDASATLEDVFVLERVCQNPLYSILDSPQQHAKRYKNLFFQKRFVSHTPGWHSYTAMRAPAMNLPAALVSLGTIGSRKHRRNF
jgi:hypothetical protein